MDDSVFNQRSFILLVSSVKGKEFPISMEYKAAFSSRDSLGEKNTVIPLLRNKLLLNVDLHLICFMFI